ncbi:cation/H(+) antiporter 4 [Beta vulgaris subsp. vulgaris]|uniref:cation/H(+) antiporter 4 n=1 Tax=Beta vulgaris subsp. vulgaris TaxID=3555 RepID=UPI002546B462|nr:cation/H(+) antiporter 4 [Beta vulgaris subsp. vulgaris]
MNSTSIKQPFCMRVPPWYPKEHLVEFPSMILQLQMFVVYCLTQAIHHSFFKHFGLPPLVSQLIAGVLLSPEIFMGKIKLLKTIHELIFPETSDEVWKSISMLGFSLSIFIIAVKTDFTIIKKTGKKPIIIGLLVLIFTSISSTTSALVYGKFAGLGNNDKKMGELTSSASVLALSTFPVIAVLLSDLKLINSELGRLALSCGIIGEIAGITHTLVAKSVLSTIALLKEHKKKEVMVNIGNRVVGLIVFFLAVFFIFRPWMKRIIKKTPKGKQVKDNYLILIFLLMLVGGILTDISGEFVIVGCFVMGAAVPDGPPLGSSIVNKFDTFVSGILQPFLITMSAIRANVFKINFHDKVTLGEVLVTVSGFTAKILVCIGCGFYYDMAISDALSLAAIMSSKGIVDIGLFNMFIDSQLIGDSTYAYLILVTIGVAIIVPIIIKFLYQPQRKYAGYENRDIVSCNLEAHLRVLCCVSRPDNVPPFIHLLALSNPTTNHMIVDVLHLIKLAGRAQPIFISHDLQEGNESENMSYSEDVISAFNSLIQRASMEEDLFIHFFTTVTPPKAMHDDICTLALDNLASLIILPFHRKLSILDGSIEFEDHAQRVLNSNILERAPCSVGIFINRGTFKLPIPESSNLTSVVVQSPVHQQNEFSAAVILLGGTDDQEAVAYAKRMASFKVWVLVIRLVSYGDQSELSELDSKTLQDIQEYKKVNPQFKYSEQKVQDGSQTAKMLRSLAEEFDLIIVGRRHNLDCPQTSGLQQWSEVRELGILGDMLASPDFPGKTSILVVQRQKQWTLKGYKHS